MAASRVRVTLAGLVLAGLALAPAAPASAFTIGGPGGAVPQPPAPKSSADPTMTTLARTSVAHRKTISLTSWVAAPHAKSVAKRESGGNCKAVSSSGLYRGKWQVSASFWAAYGGKTYASRADKAACSEQDLVAYRGWLASWWTPWGG